MVDPDDLRTVTGERDGALAAVRSRDRAPACPRRRRTGAARPRRGSRLRRSRTRSGCARWPGTRTTAGPRSGHSRTSRRHLRPAGRSIRGPWAMRRSSHGEAPRRAAGGYPDPVTFRPEALRGATPTGRDSGVIDYRLARRAAAHRVPQGSARAAPDLRRASRAHPRGTRSGFTDTGRVPRVHRARGRGHDARARHLRVRPAAPRARSVHHGEDRAGQARPAHRCAHRVRGRGVPRLQLAPPHALVPMGRAAARRR